MRVTYRTELLSEDAPASRCGGLKFPGYSRTDRGNCFCGSWADRLHAFWPTARLRIARWILPCGLPLIACCVAIVTNLSANDIIDIGSRRELFVDRFLFEPNTAVPLH